MKATSQIQPSISVLVSARRNSKYLAKFMFGLLENTPSAAYPDLDVRIMLNEHDTWNKELVSYFESVDCRPGYPGISFYRENKALGRAGLHEYFNDLYEHATGNWIIYFCDDHFITMRDWDNYIRQIVRGGSRAAWRGTETEKRQPMDPREPWCIVPKFDNCGAMNHVLSRGYLEALGKRPFHHGWIDSYINELNKTIPDRVVRMDDPAFHDFTHDHPNPMDKAENQGLSTDKGKALPAWGDHRIEALIEVDRALLGRKIEKGHR